MRKLLLRYRRLPWFVHTMIVAHLLGVMLLPAYFVLRWYGPRQLVNNMPWTTPPDEKVFDMLVQQLRYDRLEIGGERWVTFWYKGGVIPNMGETAWSLRHPRRLVQKFEHPDGVKWAVYEGGTYTGWVEKKDE